jgi:peptidoglycan biosynthesis protein MviN/MurJ (putative lipid II flippase)
MHAAWIPAIIALIATTINIILNILFIEQLQTVGLALATTISSIIQTILFIIVLHKKYKFRLYVQPFMTFIGHYTLQLSLISALFLLVYYSIVSSIPTLFPAWLSEFLLIKIGLWLWVGPVAGFFFFMIWYLRKNFGVKLHFLE